MSYQPIPVCLDLKDISFIKIFKGYMCQKLELMYQKICVGNTGYSYFNSEIKEDNSSLYLIFTI